MAGDLEPRLQAGDVIDKRQIEVGLRAIILAKGLAAGTAESVILYGENTRRIEVVVPAGAADLEADARKEFHAYGVNPSVPSKDEVERLYGRR